MSLLYLYEKCSPLLITSLPRDFIAQITTRPLFCGFSSSKLTPDFDVVAMRRGTASVLTLSVYDFTFSTAILLCYL